MWELIRQNISQDCRATVVRRSCDVRASVANLSPRNYGEFTMRNFRDTRTNVVRVSQDGRATVLRKPRDYQARKKTTKASISLACEFLATVLRILSRTFARHSCECRENFLVSRTSRELVAKFFNMLKNFMRIFSPKYFARLSRDCRATVARRSCECRELVATKFLRIYNAKFLRHSYECRASVARRTRDSLAKTFRLSGEIIRLSNIRTNVA